ncbi:response regulator transcription factor [Thalassovita taeanensis]|uniref:Response regulator receiver domain-containing protein n=1 Tax=Thalassovita taeanensis TaxID=657014 RepID=A0A1H9B5R7_9RHOB|nr:response regulator [Thalassovita taeanensis]SEP84051.1 Response regulator receiver domain-containing protein [Thalassovita taeanensis]
MKVLIVEPEPELGRLWKRHLQRLGGNVTLVQTQYDAIEALRADAVEIIVLDLVVAGGSSLAIADYASYRRPEARIVFVTNTTFFSDGSIFRHSANACAYLPTGVPPEDLAAMVEHYARPS